MSLWVEDLYRRPAAFAGADHDIAGQQHAEAAFEVEGLVCKVGVAGAEDDVGLHLQSSLLLQGCLHVDLGQHAESLLGESRPGAGDRLGVGQVRADAALVGSLRSTPDVFGVAATSRGAIAAAWLAKGAEQQLGLASRRDAAVVLDHLLAHLGDDWEAGSGPPPGTPRRACG